MKKDQEDEVVLQLQAATTSIQAAMARIVAEQSRMIEALQKLQKVLLVAQGFLDGHDNQS